MKKCTLFAAFVAMLMVVMPAKAQTTENKDAKQQIQDETEMAILKAQAAQAQIDAQNAQYTTPVVTGQRIYVPCKQEAMDKRGEYMGGLGIAENQSDRGEALLMADKYAVENITKRYVGVMLNGISHYGLKTSSTYGGRSQETELQGEAWAIGSKVINKYAEQACVEFEIAPSGYYTCYVAVQVPIDKVVVESANELGLFKDNEERQIFIEYIMKELNKYAAQNETQPQSGNTTDE